MSSTVWAVRPAHKGERAPNLLVAIGEHRSITNWRSEVNSNCQATL
jgi:hypothetical protein